MRTCAANVVASTMSKTKSRDDVRSIDERANAFADIEARFANI